VSRFASAAATAARAAYAAILPRRRPRSARTTRVTFMTYKGTTAERPTGGARAAAARLPRTHGRGARDWARTTILRRH